MGAANVAETVAIDSAAFGAKYQSKRECYRFLTHDCGAYLASYQSMTIWHMRDLISGARKRIQEADVKVLQVPHFEGLKIESFLEYAADKPHVMMAFPLLERERLALPRSYVSNVIYTLVKEPFKKWVERVVNKRHEKRREDKAVIHMDPEIAAIFQASTATSGKYRLSI